MNKKLTKLVNATSLTFILMLISFIGFSQTTTTLNPIADASVYQSGATTNYGSTTFQIKGSPSGQTRIGYVKFDLGTTAAADVKSAKFRMYCNSYPTTSSSNVVVSSTSDNWVESTITYNNRPTLNTALASVNITASGVYYEWDVTNYIKALLATNTIASFGLSDPSNSDKTIVFNKREDASNKPELVISDTPAPSNNTIPVTFNNLFSDYAIIQQQKAATPIFGFAGIGTQITVTPSWNNVAYTGTTDINGMWKINVATPAANALSYSVEAKDQDGHSVTINNVKLGEVWFCAGQSNMEMRLKGFGDPVTSPIKDGPAIIAAANDPDIRMFTLPTTLSISPNTNLTGTWNVSNPSNAYYFSAIAYQYALALKTKLNVPIGVIVSAVGGIPIQSLMSKESLVPFPEVTVPTTLDNDKATPTSVYNGMVSPVAAYGIKGFIWYQGESNRDQPDLYRRLFPAMIADYRSKWNDANLPFYFVQIAPNNYSVPFGGAIMREVLYDSYKAIPNTGISLPMEVGEASEIHYADKTTPANRLSYIALNKTYGYTNIPYLGPEFKSVSFAGNTATISFNYANGLKIKGNTASLFEIAGADKVFVPATAVINTGTNQINVVATNPAQVLNPAFVRYAFSNFVVGNLFNGDDLPASSFRTKNYDFDIDVNFHVYLLTGQSNMSGRGLLSQDTYNQNPNPRIKMLKQDGTWVTALNPLHGELESAAAVGPGISFAVKMLENADPSVTIGLIPTAIGGQPIAAFYPGAPNDRNSNSIYNESVRFVNIAKTKGVLKGVLFHQGESNNSSSSEWVTGVKALISNFRTTFNDQKLPFVFGEMGRFPSNPTKYSNILAVMPGVASDVPYTSLVSSSGLTDIGDATHFNTSSTIILGQRYADAMKGVIATLPVSLTKFTAIKKTDGALIQWTTASELNNDRFELERSTDGKIFINIANIKGKGTSTTINNYSFTDRNPSNGVNYYRLVQYDFDGKASTSDVVALTFSLADNGNDFSILIYPNPTKEKIFVNIKAQQNSQVKVAIYNLQGQLMKQLSFSGNELIQQDIQELKTGVYILRVNDANTNKLIGESKFLKN